MKPKQLAALQESIAYWEENLAKLDWTKLQFGREVCPLCKLNYLSCQECPIYLVSGKPDCDNTPFYPAYAAFHNWQKAPFENPEVWYNARDRWRSACQVEIDFLRSILPAEGEGELAAGAPDAE